MMPGGVAAFLRPLWPTAPLPAARLSNELSGETPA